MLLRARIASMTSMVSSWSYVAVQSNMRTLPGLSLFHTIREAQCSEALALFWLLRPDRTVMVAMIGGPMKDIMSGIPDYEEEV
jgi:hypothetical protein